MSTLPKQGKLSFPLIHLTDAIKTKNPEAF